MGIRIGKEQQKSILIDASVHTRLSAFCGKHNLLIKDFVPMALEYFEKTGIDIRSDVKAEVEEGIKSRLDKQDESSKAIREELAELRRLVGDTQQQTNQNVINVLQTVVNSVQEQQAGQQKLLERTKPKKVVGHLWWKKVVDVEEDNVQDITAEEVKE